MLYGQGKVWLNGSVLPSSSAIFPGDLVQTKPDSVANINGSRASVTVLSDSVVKYEANAVVVDKGAISITTSKNTSVRAGDVTITPASSEKTQFQVQDRDGTLQIVASKGDLTVNDGDQTTTVPEGQQTTRDDSDKKRRKKEKGGGGAPGAAQGSVLDSTIAIGAGAVVIGGVTAWVLSRSSEPLSPAAP